MAGTSGHQQKMKRKRGPDQEIKNVKRPRKYISDDNVVLRPPTPRCIQEWDDNDKSWPDMMPYDNDEKNRCIAFIEKNFNELYDALTPELPLTLFASPINKNPSGSSSGLLTAKLSKPSLKSSSKLSSGSSSKFSSGSSSKPSSGSSAKFSPGSSSKPSPGTSSKTGSGTSSKTSSGSSCKCSSGSSTKIITELPNLDVSTGLPPKCSSGSWSDMIPYDNEERNRYIAFINKNFDELYDALTPKLPLTLFTSPIKNNTSGSYSGLSAESLNASSPSKPSSRSSPKSSKGSSTKITAKQPRPNVCSGSSTEVIAQQPQLPSIIRNSTELSGIRSTKPIKPTIRPILSRPIELKALTVITDDVSNYQLPKAQKQRVAHMPNCAILSTRPTIIPASSNIPVTELATSQTIPSDKQTKPSSKKKTKASGNNQPKSLTATITKPVAACHSKIAKYKQNNSDRLKSVLKRICK